MVGQGVVKRNRATNHRRRLNCESVVEMRNQKWWRKRKSAIQSSRIQKEKRLLQVRAAGSVWRSAFRDAESQVVLR